jgi:protease I
MAQKKAAVLIEDFYQDMEVWYPYYRLIEAGFDAKLVAKEANKDYKGKNGYPATSEVAAKSVKGSDFDVVIIPGGWAPDKMRLIPEMVAIVRDAHKAGKIIGCICHGGWMLVTAGILKGKTVTCYEAIKDDVVNAGAKFVDREVVKDGNLITSRKPSDLPAFMREILASC